MRRTSKLFIYLGCLFLLNSSATIPKPSTPVLAEYHFAISLQPSGNTQYFTTAMVKVYEGKVLEVNHLTADKFILQATGLIYSKANESGENKLVKHEVGSCTASIDETTGDYTVDCNPIQNIWKLRYSIAPTQMQGKKGGWSKMKFRPSDGQLQILKQYGIGHLHEFAYGENAFRLLRDVSRPEWVSAYSGS